jgi:hypothetical protein
MSSNSMSTIVKGAVVGLATGVAVGYAGKKMMDSNPKLKKKANKAFRTMGTIVDTAQFMFK